MTVVRESATTAAPATLRRARAVREILLVASLFLAYEIGRILATGHVAGAMANAGQVWHLERLAGLPDEASLQHLILGRHTLVRAADSYYAYVHFPATAIALIWMYRRRPEHYVWMRRVLAALTAAALVVHLLVPLAPPRMLAESGLADTGRLYGPEVYGSPASDPLSNQYAAMPSLHVGWALAVAIALIAATRGRWRRLWLAHPLLTLLVVVATGNHYWLDGLVAMAILGVVLLVVPRPGDVAIRAPRLRPAPAARIPAQVGRVRPPITRPSPAGSGQADRGRRPGRCRRTGRRAPAGTRR